MTFLAAAISAPAQVSAPREDLAPQLASDILQDAPVALLVDMTTGQTLVSRNDRHRFLPASVTKVMTLYLAFELIERGKLDPSKPISMRDKTHAEWEGKGSTMFIRQGQEVPLDSILAGIANISANDASMALAESSGGSVQGWTAMMNDEARKLGMQDSHFATPNGWPDDGKTFTTARDLEILAHALITRHPRKYAEYFGRDGFAFNGVAQANHDPITRRVRGADGIKTGYTNEAGHTFLGSAERDGTRLVMVLAGVEDYDDRSTTSRQLIEWGFDGFERVVLFPKGAKIGTASVQDAGVDDVELVAQQTVKIAIPKGARRDINLSIRYSGPLRAPLSSKTAAARLVVDIDGMTSATFPLAPAKDVAKAGFFERIANGFASWFA